MCGSHQIKYYFHRFSFKIIKVRTPLIFILSIYFFYIIILYYTLYYTKLMVPMQHLPNN